MFCVRDLIIFCIEFGLNEGKMAMGRLILHCALEDYGPGKL